MTTDTKLPLRLAMRREGDNWVAYMAKIDTMEDAVLLGSIRMGLVVNNTGRRDAFIGLMQDAMGEFISDRVGVEPNWQPEQDAPEHERSGTV